MFACAAGLVGGLQTNTVLAEDAFSYADVSNLDFYFSSGVGAWWTELSIHADGSFDGYYQDSDMGDQDTTYPNGTVYVCDFSGQFTDLVKINEYTYSTTIQDMELAKEAGTTEIEDGIRYIASEPYGLDGAENILFYLKGAPLEELPEEYRSWVGYIDLSGTEDTELPFIGLYNEAAEDGFSSYEKSAIDMELEEIVNQASELEDQIDSGLLSQSEMNQLSAELYTLWDDELNSIWKRLKESLPEDEMAQLTEEELQWISEKEEAVTEAGSEFEGGSMQPLVENTTAAKWTRERVYELAVYLRGIQ
jgi:uncharacterized protein YecT (DUF1311 family)